jgi:hypothetical protein
MSKPEFWWCVRFTNGKFILSTARSTKEDCREARLEYWNSRSPWPRDRKRLPPGESVVRIRVEEVPGKKGGRR